MSKENKIQPASSVGERIRPDRVLKPLSEEVNPDMHRYLSSIKRSKTIDVRFEEEEFALDKKQVEKEEESLGSMVSEGKEEAKHITGRVIRSIKNLVNTVSHKRSKKKLAHDGRG